jgi:hypothetical protein
MAMSSAPEEFKDLQRLLHLKRRESPPPGYFRDFSAGVIRRIEREQTAQETSWWRSLFPKPASSLTWANILACVGVSVLGVTAFNLFRHADGGPVAVGTAVPQLGGVSLDLANGGWALPVDQAPDASISRVAYSDASLQTAAPASSTNPMPDGMFGIPTRMIRDSAVRVSYGE